MIFFNGVSSPAVRSGIPSSRSAGSSLGLLASLSVAPWCPWCAVAEVSAPLNLSLAAPGRREETRESSEGTDRDNWHTSHDFAFCIVSVLTFLGGLLGGGIHAKTLWATARRDKNGGAFTRSMTLSNTHSS